MYTFIQIFYLAALFIPSSMFAQQQDKASRFTLGFAIGTGFSGQDKCYDTGAYYKAGLVSGYRFSRFLSLESNLQFLHLDGLVYGYSNGASFELSGLRQWRNVTLMLGPTFHLPARHGIEWSLAPKAGMTLNRTVHYIQNFGIPYQTRFYEADFQSVYEADFRMSWWFTDGIAFETSVGVFGTLNGDKALTTSKIEGSQIPDDSQMLPPAFLEELTQHMGQMSAWNLNLGFRFRL
jgi:hypothetical protein